MTPLAKHLQMAEERYQYDGFSLDHIRNRQEVRVVAAMRDLLPHADDFCGCRLCVEDVYAIALNSLPAHYIQSGAMVLGQPPPTEQDVVRAVADALDKVRVRPNHPE